MWIIDDKMESNAGKRVTTGLKADSGFCVSHISGAVGYITQDGLCHVDAAGYIHSITKYQSGWGSGIGQMYSDYPR